MENQRRLSLAAVRTVAEKNTERINLSPFTKDFRVFISLRHKRVFLCLVLLGPLIEFRVASSSCEVLMSVIERAIREEEIVLLITKYLEVASFTAGIDR